MSYGEIRLESKTLYLTCNNSVQHWVASAHTYFWWPGAEWRSSGVKQSYVKMWWYFSCIDKWYSYTTDKSKILPRLDSLAFILATRPKASELMNSRGAVVYENIVSKGLYTCVSVGLVLHHECGLTLQACTVCLRAEPRLGGGCLCALTPNTHTALSDSGKGTDAYLVI